MWWIRQSILQALAEQARIVRLPLNKIGNINKINKTFSSLEQEYEREPTAEEIASEMDCSAHDVKESMKNSGRHISMDAPLSQSEEGTLYDVLDNKDTPSPDQTLLQESLRKEIDRAISTLTEREANIVRMYFGIGQKNPSTLEEIGAELGLTRERVRQIKEKAVRRLKQTARSKILKSYLG